MGGVRGHGPVVVEPDEPVFHEPWEARVFANNFLGGRWTVPEFRPSSGCRRWPILPRPTTSTGCSRWRPTAAEPAPVTVLHVALVAYVFEGIAKSRTLSERSLMR